MLVVKLKQLVEEKTGKDAELMRLFHEHAVMNDHETLEASGIPNQTELYASSWTKLVVTEHVGIPAQELTNRVLAGLCVELAEAPPDILDLNGCEGITDISCLAQFDALSTLSMSGCYGITGSMIQCCVQAMPGLLHLNVSNCGLQGDDCALVADALHDRYLSRRCYNIQLSMQASLAQEIALSMVSESAMHGTRVPILERCAGMSLAMHVTAQEAICTTLLSREVCMYDSIMRGLLCILERYMCHLQHFLLTS
jgi:hypothetical protein